MWTQDRPSTSASSAWVIWKSKLSSRARPTSFRRTANSQKIWASRSRAVRFPMLTSHSREMASSRSSLRQRACVISGSRPTGFDTRSAGISPSVQVVRAATL